MNLFTKLSLLFFFIIFFVSPSKSEVLFSTMNTAESSDNIFKVRPRYWRAQAFVNNKNFNKLTKIRVKIKDFTNNILDINKLRGRIYTSIVAWAPCSIDDNKIGELNYAGSIEDGGSLIVDLVPSSTILLSPKGKYYFAFNGDGCQYPHPHWVLCQKSK